MHKSELNSFIENSSNLPFHKNSLSYVTSKFVTLKVSESIL